LSLCIFRNEELGLDHSAFLSHDDQLILKMPSRTKSGLQIPKSLERGHSTTTLSDELHRSMPFKHRPEATITKLRHSRLSASDLRKLTIVTDFENYKPMDNARFRRRIQDGVVDVWWLFDDGGLELLVAHLLTKPSSYLQGAVLRVFTIAPQKHKIEVFKVYLIQKLKKFRIEFSEIYVLNDEDTDLFDETVAEYDDLLNTINSDEENLKIPPEMLNKYTCRTKKIMRQRELMLEYSKASSLVIVTLPVALQNVIMTPLYQLWLELLSKNMPPTLFVRGNQASVLTFYS